MQNAIKRFREHKEKDVFCFHCRIYTATVHYCTMEKKWIHLDCFNRIIIYSSTEKGANPKNPNDISDGVTISMQKFAIDRRETIMIEEKEKEKEKEEKQKRVQHFEVLKKKDDTSFIIHKKRHAAPSPIGEKHSSERSPAALEAQTRNKRAHLRLPLSITTAVSLVPSLSS